MQSLKTFYSALEKIRKGQISDQLINDLIYLEANGTDISLHDVVESEVNSLSQETLAEVHRYFGNYAIERERAIYNGIKNLTLEKFYDENLKLEL